METTVIVNEETDQKQYALHASLLSHHSYEFSNKLGPLDPDTELKPLVVENVSFETFDCFAQWIQSQTEPDDGITVDELETAISLVTRDINDGGSESGSTSSSSNGDDSDKEDGGEVEEEGDSAARLVTVNGSATPGEPSPASAHVDQDSRSWYAGFEQQDRVFGRLIDLLVFAARYDCPDFQRAAMLQLQRCVYMFQAVPCPAVVNRACDALKIQAPLCRYLGACYEAHTKYKTMSIEHYSTLRPEFLAGILKVKSFHLYNQPASFYHGKVQIKSAVTSRWCDFHEHNDEDERDKCRRRRAQDPDGYRPTPRRFRVARKSAPVIPKTVSNSW